MQKLFVRFTKSERIYIRLDANGSAVWNLINGKRTVREIVEMLSKHFVNEEGYDSRITMFVSQLHKSGFIKYKVSL